MAANKHTHASCNAVLLMWGQLSTPCFETLECRERGMGARYINQTTQHVVQRRALVTSYYDSWKFD